MKKRILLIIGIIILVVIGIFIYLQLNGKVHFFDEVIYIKNKDDQKIYSVLHRPNKKGKVPIVIYSHGLGATYRACEDYADKLKEKGVATICFDFRGGSDRSKSDGSTKEMSFLTEMDDLETIIEEVKTWDFVDNDNIILMGSSQGGAVSALISAKRDDIKGTVLLYPALGIPSSVSKWYSSKDKIPEEVKMTQKITVGKKYFLDVWDYDVYSEIVKDKKDILIIQGTSDLLVLPSQTKKVHKIYENSELFFIEGAGHGFDGDDFDEAMGYIINYLKKMKVIK